MNRRKFNIGILSVALSAAATGTMYLSTPTQRPRRRMTKRRKSTSEVFAVEQQVNALLKAKMYDQVIQYLEVEKFAVITPARNSSGFKLLNLLAGMKVRYQKDNYQWFLLNMQKFIYDNLTFKYNLYDNWKSESFRRKWSLKTKDNKPNIRAWSSNVV